jgi:hypothetical protein
MSRDPAENLVRVPAARAGAPLASETAEAIEIVVRALRPGIVAERTIKDADTVTLRHGIVPAEGSGQIAVQLRYHKRATQEASTQKPTWNLNQEMKEREWELSLGEKPAVWLSDGDRVLPLRVVPPKTKGPDFPVDLYTVVWTPATPQWFCLEPANPKPIWDEWIARCSHGSALTLGVRITRPPSPGTSMVFEQELRVPLTLCRASHSLTPLRPVFVQFEDPEYNRRLSSTPQQDYDTARIRVFAVDRQEYDPQAEVVYAFRGQDEKEICYLELWRHSRDGSEQPLLPAAGSLLRLAVPASKIQRINLAHQPLVAGDTLHLKLFEEQSTTSKKDALIETTVPIVATPVIPAPGAAYTLLRRSSTTAVRAVRHARGPTASRIDLLDPEDLFKSLVRRRAIFQWLSHLPFTIEAPHAVLKTSSFGHTHVPEL